MSEAQPVPLARLLRPAPAAISTFMDDDRLADAGARARAEADHEWRARLTEAEEQHAKAMAQADEVLAQRERLTANLLAALDSQFAGSLATLAHAIVRQILEAEPPFPAETLRALVAEAIAALPEGEAGTIHLAPRDLPGFAPPAGWRFQADPALGSGTVRVEAGPALARAALSLRLEAFGARQRVTA
jgi:flagellar biosynthesis/type III secretory pathway protein FliH